MTKTSTLKWFVAFSLSLVNFIALADEISLIDNNGIYMVPITLNGTVNVAGILDTGASEMFLPFNVIATLIQSGSINSKDILKSGTYTLADGTVKTRERVNIEKIKIGNNTYNNVTAIVGPNNSNILIGQNLLKNINYSINNTKKIMIITQADEPLSLSKINLGNMASN